MNADFVLSATIALKDNFTAQVNKAKSGFRDFERSLRGASATIDSTAASMEKSGLAAVKLSQQADRAKRSLTGIRGVYSATVRAKDEATQAVRRIKTELSGLQGKAYTAIVNIRQNGPLQQMRNGLSGMAGGMLMGTSMQMAGAAGIGFGAFNAVQNYSDFTAQLSQIKALTNLDSQTMEQVKAKAMELGDATTFSSTEAAQGMTELLKAGVSVKDVLGDASEAALNLATAGGLGMGEAAEIMSTAMNAFHMDNATHAADILAGAANASATSVQEMRYSLAACSAVAAGAGVSFDDTNTALAVFAQNGLKGSDAGTSLKTMLQNMIPTTKTQMEAFAELNLLTENGTSAFFDASGNMKSMADIAALLQDRLKGLTKEQQMTYLNAMFGSDAIRGGMILMREGAKGVKDMYDAMSKVTAADTAAVMMDNLKGSLNELSSAWENLTIKLLDHGVGDGLRSFTDEFGKLTSHFSGLIDDGLQVTDVIKIVGEGINDLKNKFLAFDGIGSVLAGGALAVGLKKIYNLAMKVKDVIQGIPKNLPGGTPTGGNGLPSTSSVKDMVVTATNVIINSKGAPTTAPTSAPPTNAPVPVPEGTPKGTPKPGWGARLSSWAKRVPWIGSAIALGGTALDVAYAPEGEKLSTAGRDAAGLAGSFVGMKGGAAFGASVGTAVPGVGTAVGAIVGGIAGGIAGQKLAEAFQSINWDSFSQVINEKNAEWSQTFAQLGPTIASTFEGIRQSMSDTADWLDAKQAELHQYMADSWEGIKQSGVDSWDMICQVADEKNAEWSQTFADAKNRAGSFGGLDWDNEVQYASQSFDRISAQFAAKNQEWVDAYAQSCAQMQAKGQEWETSIQQNLDGFANYMNIKTDEAKTFALGCWDTIATTAAEKNQQWAQSFDEAKNRAGQSLEALKTWASGVWDSLAQGASAAASSISAKLSGAWDAVQGAAPSFNFDVGSIFDHNATGSTHFAGGWTEVNERGGEAIWLPNGSWIYPHATTERMLQKQLAQVGSGSAPQVTISGNTFTVREEADISRIAYELLKLMSTAHANYGGV